MSSVEYVFYNGNWYHPNFFKRRIICLKKAKQTCRQCGMKRGDTYISKKGRESKVVIQAHHPNGDRKNPRALLIALCKSCHMKADGFEHAIKGVRTIRRMKREAQIAAGQLELPLSYPRRKQAARA